MASGISTTVLSLALAMACLAGTSASAADPAPAEQAPAVVAPRPDAPRRHARRRSAGHGLEERVQQLARRLDLDAKQQAELRRILERQHQQVKRLWADSSLAGAEHVGATRAIMDRTGEQIRAMLRGDQLRKYGVAPPRRDAEHAAQPDVEHWMHASRPVAGQEPGRRAEAP